MVQARHLPRYAQLALLFTRYGRRDFHLPEGVEAEVVAGPETEKPLPPGIHERAKEFAEALEEMGPTFIKFGQLLSTRPDIVPKPYLDALESFQDHVESFSFAEVERIVEDELEVKISKAFSDFDSEPVAAASLGQVHAAALRDGRQVVVKVQRPKVREQVEEDLKMFAEMAEFLDRHSSVARNMNLLGSIEQIRRSLMNELNYVQEARNLEAFRTNLAEFEEIYIPQVIDDYSTSRVLTMELVHGKKVSKLTPLEIIDHDYEELAVVITRAYLKQICVDGFWHSDPHPGNVFIEEDRLVLLDFGMVSRISGEMQDDVVKFLLAVSDNRGEEVAEICLRLGEPQKGFEKKKFFRDVSALVGAYHDVDLRETNTGRLIFSVIALANGNRLQVPAELAMLAKTLLHLDGITKKLDPEFNPRETIKNYTEELIVKKVRQKLQPRNYYSALIDLNQLALELPRRLRRVVDQVENGRLTLSINLLQIDHLIKAMQKIANRVTVGLVIAALLVGSALVMRVPSSVTLFGYPALAVVGFILASAIGFYLVISILAQDRRDRKKARQP